MIYFTWRENSSGTGWLICPFHENFKNPKIEGSWNVVPARFLGLSWEDYLKFCMQNGAMLHGKNKTYILPVFKKKNNEFLNLLNERTEKIIKIVGLENLKF